MALLARLHQRNEAVYRRYRVDPCGYAARVLGVNLTDDQREILRSVAENRRTAVKASHAIGKTFAASVLACWWYDCWDQHIVYITAPSWDQALGLTFKQIKRTRQSLMLPGDILETGWVRDAEKTRAPGHFIRALNAERGEGFQGEHTAPILVILEEAVGVPGYIWEASDGLMTHPDCRLLAIANPTDKGTPFGLACDLPSYNVLSASALRHPNIAAEQRGEDPPFPDAVRLAWVREMLEKECEPVEGPAGDAFEFPLGSGEFYAPNAVFQGRVLGDFPTQADEQVIPNGWLANLPILVPAGTPEIGCDVARHGSDRTTIAVRHGGCLLALREIRRMDLAAVTGALKQAARETASAVGTHEKAIEIKIDVTGGLGAGPCDALASEGYQAFGINSSSKAIDENNYPNRRSELWFDVRERARTKDLDLSRLPADMRRALVRELSTPKWKSDSKGRKVVQPKDEIKKQIGASPDLADGVNLAFARPSVSLDYSSGYAYSAPKSPAAVGSHAGSGYAF